MHETKVQCWVPSASREIFLLLGNADLSGQLKKLFSVLEDLLDAIGVPYRDRAIRADNQSI
jgi:hypothetical protein